MTKEQEEAIERLEKRIKDNKDYKTTQVWLTDDVSAVYTVLNMLKENSAEIEQKNTELAEKSAEIEKYKSLYNKALEDLVKADRENIENKKVIDLMVKAMNKIQDPQVCKYCDNNINLNHGYCTDAKKCKEGIKQYFESKVEE